MSLPPWLSGPPAGVAAKSAAIAAATRKPHPRAAQPGRRVKRRNTRAADMDPDVYGYDVGDDDDTDPRVRAGSETQRSQRRRTAAARAPVLDCTSFSTRPSGTATVPHRRSLEP